MSTAMMKSTTRSSISVKPRRLLDLKDWSIGTPPLGGLGSQ
jgi:hypothetical protein